MTDVTPDEQAAIDEAIGQAVAATDPGDVVLGYLLIVETLDGETGERALITRADDGSTPWSIMGRVEFARRLLAQAPELDVD